MLNVLRAAVAALVLTCAGSANAATLFWSGVVGENNRGGDALYLPQVAGLYTFVSAAQITEFFDFSVTPLEKYHLHSDGVIEYGHNYYASTWEDVGKPAPILTLTSTGFTMYIDPPTQREKRTDLDVCDEWYGCGYWEYWEYHTQWYMIMKFAAGSEGEAMNLYFEPGPPSSAVPEPSTWALLITGFGLAGAALRRRRVPVPRALGPAVAAVALTFAGQASAAVTTFDFEGAQVGQPVPWTLFDGGGFSGGTAASSDFGTSLQLAETPDYSGPLSAFDVYGAGKFWDENDRQYIWTPKVVSFDLFLPNGGTINYLGYAWTLTDLAPGWTTITLPLLNLKADRDCAWGCRFFINGGGALVDNVVLDLSRSGIPEPATWLMLVAGFGMAGTALRRRCSATHVTGRRMAR